ncbi:unnamed protein product [Adineta steineri]|uniref:Diacylglycerol kinase n=1 Tax=Adineta steineri TaxID=433720 RepID=A0A814S700_9BILA|nr:unnamed protein product [Adineta steineri]
MDTPSPTSVEESPASVSPSLPFDISTLSTNNKSILHSTSDDNNDMSTITHLSTNINQNSQELVNHLSEYGSHQLLDKSTDDHDNEQLKQDVQSIMSQQLVDANQINISQLVLSSSLPTSSESSDNISITYGVDWSDRACPTSHCWFPLTANDSSIAHLCVYMSCTNSNLMNRSTLVRCETCALVVHSHHLNELQTAKTHFLPHCRPSFVDNTMLKNFPPTNEHNSSLYDQHFWSHVPVLPKPCLHCQQISMKKTLSRSISDLSSTKSSLDITGQFKSMMSYIPRNFRSTTSESSNGMVCLWCSQVYHRSCWARVAVNNDKLCCDYGAFRDIIVRPHWLSRSTESSAGFRAQLPPHLTNDSSESKPFPYTPVIIFINKRSGGQVGEKIYRELLQKLNPRQVFLLENNDTITHALEIYSSLPNTRICVFGGDGTVGWVLSCLADAYPSSDNPPVGICPLGTGNDLSRVLGWGGQYDPKHLCHTLVQIPHAQPTVLDRWEVKLEEFNASTTTISEQKQSESESNIRERSQSLSKQLPTFVRETNRDFYHNYHQLPNTRFINYMSFGLDAAVTLAFHHERIHNPSKFSSPWKNKFMYVNESFKHFEDFTRANSWNLSPYIHLTCNGHDLTDLIRGSHTLIVLNIPGYAAGTDPWGRSTFASTVSSVESPTDLHETYLMVTSNDNDTNETVNSSMTSVSCDFFERQNFGDKKIEVVALSTTHMASLHIGYRGNRVAQCDCLRIELCCPMTAQMDGEPFYFPTPTAINITHAGQVFVLNNENN